MGRGSAGGAASYQRGPPGGNERVNRCKMDGVSVRPEPRCIMTISLDLTPEQQRELEDLARRSGKDPSAYVNEVLTAYLNGARAKGQKTFEEILAPIWEGWRHSGMTGEEIDELFEHELREVQRER